MCFGVGHRCLVLAWFTVALTVLNMFCVGVSVQSAQIDAHGDISGGQKPLMRSGTGVEVTRPLHLSSEVSPSQTNFEIMRMRVCAATELLGLTMNRVFGAKSTLRDERPAIAFFRDSECKNEVGGFYFPAQARIEHDTCFPIQHRNPSEAVWTFGRHKNAHMNMLWECIADGGGLNIRSSTNRECSHTVDDMWSVHVKTYNLPGMVASRCTEAMNEGQFQAEYVKIINSHHVQEWPPCVQENLLRALIIAISSTIAFMCCCTGAYCAFWKWKWRQRTSASPTKSNDPLLTGLDVKPVVELVQVEIKKPEDGKVGYEVGSTLLVSKVVSELEPMKEGASIVKVDGIAVATFEDYEKAIKGKNSFTLTLRQQSDVKSEKAKAATGGYKKARESKRGKDSKGKSVGKGGLQ